MYYERDNTDKMKKRDLKTRKSINYDNYLKIINERDDLLVSITPDQFRIAMEKNDILPRGNRLRPSHVKL